MSTNHNDPKKQHRMSADYLNMTVKSPSGASYNPIQTPTTEGVRTSFLNLEQEDEDHRLRFLNDAEKEIATHPKEARESQDALAMTDENLWHLQPLDILMKRLESDREIGLSTVESEKRLQSYGPNSLDAEEKTPVYIIFILQYCNLIVMLLLTASIASLILQEWVEGFAILAIITLNACIATYQEKSASNALEALAKMSSPQCTVLRDGAVKNVDSDQLVRGDIVYLVTGDVVPADLRLLESNDLKVNEMLLTGESEDVSKKWNAKVRDSKKLTQDNMVFSSTTVAAGNGIGAVVETGMGTRVGSIAKLLKGSKDVEEKNPIKRFMAKHQPKMTPLQHALHKLGVFMGALAFSVCALVFVVGMIRDQPDPKHPERPTWLTMVMFSVSLAVSAVPEGLPMVVTICLSSGTADMVRKNVLVRKLAAVETLGSASVICTDKTGTLTEGKMTALKMWSDFKEYTLTGKGFIPEGDILHNGKSVIENVQVRSTLLSCVLCSNTKLIQEEQDGEVRWHPRGNSSEAPLVVAAAKAGIWEEYVMDKYPRLVEIPFSSSRKMMITVNETRDGHLDNLALPKGTNMVASVKGAPNYILDNCTQYVDSDGNIKDLGDAEKALVMESVDSLSSQALRVLAVAIRPLENLPFDESCDDVEEKFAALSKPLILMGLMASIDPERDGVKEAIETARQASIRTVMITGDYLKTAVAIARNIDLIQMNMDPSEAATDCKALRLDGGEYLSDVDMDEITSRTLVFARAKPEDKIEIVKSLQRQGLVSAMTGDGVNDAPALKESDIGVAMGITGTEVAKGASDMVLTDDNFCSIVSAVEKGRVIYANIQKFVCFLLSTNIGEILLLFSAIAAGMPLPLEPLQILMLNLFTDGMPAVALSLEKGDKTIMTESPRPKNQQIIYGRLWALVLLNAVFIASGTMLAFLMGTYWSFGDFLLSDIIGGEAREDYKDVVCNRWFGLSDGFRLVGDCGALNPDGSLVFPDGSPDCQVDYDCVYEGIGRAQTMTFIALALTEVLRAYTIRSFTDHVFKGIFSNKWMQYAAVGSISLTLIITNVPVIYDKLFGFTRIPWYCWMFSISCAILASFMGEMVKCCIRSSENKKRRQAVIQDGFGDVLLEVRALRHHIEHLENQMDGLKKVDEANPKIV